MSKPTIHQCSTIVAIVITCFCMLTFSKANSQTIKIVNMIPRQWSHESNNDSEPTIAVNPKFPNFIAASAFTVSADSALCDTRPCTQWDLPFSSCRAPIYLSENFGDTWEIRDVLPSRNGITHDISLAFSENGFLYAALLKGCQNRDILRGLTILGSADSIVSHPTFIGINMRELDRRYADQFDQPWIVATSAMDPFNHETRQYERIFVGANKVSERVSAGRSGSTAKVMVSYTNEADRSIHFREQPVERIPNIERNLAAVRLAVSKHGKVYAIFYRWEHDGLSGGVTTETSPPLCKVVVVLDKNFAMGENLPIDRLFDDAVGESGSIVASDQIVPISYPIIRSPGIGGALGRHRLVGSNLSIAVDPKNDDHVIVAWCANNTMSEYTLFFKETWNAGRTWETIAALPPVPNAINPAIAISGDITSLPGVRKVGILYQQLNAGNWETHFKSLDLHGDIIVGTAADYQLNSFPDASLPPLDITGRPLLGEYIDLEVVGNTFYGIFPAMNDLDRRNFLTGFGFDFQFERHFRGGRLVDNEGNVVPFSIDPFFFKVTW